MLSNARHRAKSKGIPFDLTADHIEPLLLSECPVLGIPLEAHTGRQGPRDTSPSLDRIIPDRGYVADNIIVISGRANRIKSDASFEELRAVANFYGEKDE